MPRIGFTDSFSAEIGEELIDQISALSVATVGDLPASAPNGEVRRVTDTGHYYIFNAIQNEWEDISDSLVKANLSFLRKDDNLNDIPDKAQARINLGIGASGDAYTKQETDDIVGVEYYSTSQTLAITAPRTIRFRNLTSNVTCFLPSMSVINKHLFTIENYSGTHNVIVTSVDAGVGILTKGNATFTLEPSTSEDFAHKDGAWL